MWDSRRQGCKYCRMCISFQNQSWKRSREGLLGMYIKLFKAGLKFMGFHPLTCRRSHFNATCLNYAVKHFAINCQENVAESLILFHLYKGFLSSCRLLCDRQILLLSSVSECNILNFELKVFCPWLQFQVGCHTHWYLVFLRIEYRFIYGYGLI